MPQGCLITVFNFQLSVLSCCAKFCYANTDMHELAHEQVGPRQICLHMNASCSALYKVKLYENT